MPKSTISSSDRAESNEARDLRHRRHAGRGQHGAAVLALPAQARPPRAASGPRVPVVPGCATCPSIAAIPPRRTRRISYGPRDAIESARLAARFVAEEILPRLYAPAVQRLQSHLRRGDTVVLLSGTLEPIARALAAALGRRARARHGLPRARRPLSCGARRRCIRSAPRSSSSPSSSRPRSART